MHLNIHLEHLVVMLNLKNSIPRKWPKLTVMVLVNSSIGKQTPKGPNYNPTDKFLYNKAPEYRLGTQPRNTLDTKAKYEHYFRKDIDVYVLWFSLIQMKQIKWGDKTLGILGLEEHLDFLWTKRSIRWPLDHNMILQSIHKLKLLHSLVYILEEQLKDLIH